LELLGPAQSTPKVFANCSPGFPTLGFDKMKNHNNAEGVGEWPGIPLANSFRVRQILLTGLSPRVGNPGLQFANTFGVDWAASFHSLYPRGGTNCGDSAPTSSCRRARQEGISNKSIEFLRVLLLGHHPAIVKHFQAGKWISFK